MLQIDACRVGGVNENLAILLLAAKFGVPVCPHAGGVGLCELVQHLSMFDFLAVSGSHARPVIEYVDHLHEHFVDPVRIRDGRYLVPTAPGMSAELDRDRHLPVPVPGRQGVERAAGGCPVTDPVTDPVTGPVTEFGGLRAVVTGGASGIGLATARGCCRAGRAVASST